MRGMFLAVICAASFGVQGCASMFSGMEDQVSISSNDKNAMLYVNGQLVGQEYASARVKRRSGNVIEARREGCQTVRTEMTRGLDGMTFIGCLIDGCILSVPIDLAIGGARQIDPKHYSVTPVCPAEMKQPNNMSQTTTE